MLKSILYSIKNLTATLMEEVFYFFLQNNHSKHYYLFIFNILYIYFEIFSNLYHKPKKHSSGRENHILPSFFPQYQTTTNQQGKRPAPSRNQERQFILSRIGIQSRLSGWNR